MRLEFVIPAPQDSRFGPTAFDKSRGKALRISTEATGVLATAELIDARIIDAGRGAELILEVPDHSPLARLLARRGGR